MKLEKSDTSTIVLVKGQLWKLKDRQIRIRAVYTNLVEHRISPNKGSRKKASVVMCSIANLVAYLKINEAELVTSKV